MVGNKMVGAVGTNSGGQGLVLCDWNIKLSFHFLTLCLCFRSSPVVERQYYDIIHL